MDRKLETYQGFIDELVEYREATNARRFREGVWHPEPPPNQVKHQELLDRLSEQDRHLVADIIQEAADGAIHMVLRAITDGEYRLSKRGITLAWEPYGTEMYFDFVARAAGDPWPRK